MIVHEPATHVAVLRVQGALAEVQEREHAEWRAQLAARAAKAAE